VTSFFFARGHLARPGIAYSGFFLHHYEALLSLTSHVQLSFEILHHTAVCTEAYLDGPHIRDHQSSFNNRHL